MEADISASCGITAISIVDNEIPVTFVGQQFDFTNILWSDGMSAEDSHAVHIALNDDIVTIDAPIFGRNISGISIVENNGRVSFLER